MEDNSTYAGVVLQNDYTTPVLKTQVNMRTVNDTEFTYCGAWSHERLYPRHLGYYENTLSMTEEAGATARYTVYGCTEFALYAPLNDCVMEIRVDNQPPVKISLQKDNAASSDVFPWGNVTYAAGACIFKSGTLEYGNHTIEIKAISGKVALDFLAVAGKPAQEAFIENGNGAFFYYTPGFSFREDASARSRAFLETTEIDEELEFCFKGSFIRLYGQKGPQYSSVLARMDNGEDAEISLSAPSLEYGVIFEADNLDPEEYHVLHLTTRGSISIDGAVVPCATPLMTVMNRRTDQELADMEKHIRKTIPRENWKPVPRVTQTPENNVTLLDGPMKTAFFKNIEYLKSSWKLPYWVERKDPDRIWVDLLVASNEGRMLGGMGHTLRFYEVPEFRKYIEEILEAVERRQFTNGNGYFLPYESKNFEISRHPWPGFMRDEQKNYDRAMFTKGLLAAARAGYPKVYEMLRAFYDWFNNAKEYLPLMLKGAMGIQGSIAGPMVYHSPVGKPEDIETNMKYYDMDWWLEFLSKGYAEAAWRFTLNRPHNYKLTSINALFLIYLATGDERYINAVKGAWHIYKTYFQLPGGGITLCEHQECRPWTNKLNNSPVSVFETCGNEFWIELNSNLLSIEPTNETYALEIEESLYNFMLASQGEGGRIRYFNQLNGTKMVAGHWNTCCEIQATHFFGMMPQFIYSLAENGIYINLYSPSEIKCALKSGDVVLRTETAFPKGDDVSITVDGSGQFDINLRIPAWTAVEAAVCVNGQQVAKAQPGTYYTLSRNWQKDDQISFSLPKTIRITKYMGEHRLKDYDRYSVMYGPILMAVCGPFTEGLEQSPGEPTIALPMTISELTERLKETAPLQYEIEGTSYTLRPYYEVADGETFTCFAGYKK